jgi:hypothetical protein
MEKINDTLAFLGFQYHLEQMSKNINADTLKNAINALENLGEVGYVLRKFQE